MTIVTMRKMMNGVYGEDNVNNVRAHQALSVLEELV